MKYKISFIPTPEHLTKIKEKGGIPFVCGGHTFEYGESVFSDDLLPFIHNPKMNGKKLPPTNDEIITLGLVDARLTVETLTEEPHGGDSEREI